VPNGNLPQVIMGEVAPNGTGDSDKVFKRVAWRIMPILFFIFVLSYMDRVNIGYAKLQFSGKLGLTDAAYGMGAGIFFLGYLASGIPSNILLAKIGARATISRIMVTWGIVSSLMMFISTPTEFYFLRFLLGLSEGGLAPGVYLYLTYWFPENYRARMVAIFLAALPVSGVLCAPLSGYLLETMHNVGGLDGWQWMFLLEGIPSIIVGMIVYFVVENSPGTAKWLDRDERELIVASLALDTGNKIVTKRRANIRDALVSRTFLVLAVIEIIGGVAISGFAFWLPQIVHDLGVVRLSRNGIITAIPYLSASVAMILWGYLSDHLQERRWHYAIAASLGATGLFIACLSKENIYLAIFGLSLAYSGIISCVSVFWAYATTYLKSGAAVIGIGVLNAAASLAAYASQYAFGVVSMVTKNSLFGLYGIAISLFVGALLVFLLPKNLHNV
jgi:sugar phosphate permease